jgi:hypothetical protein
MAAAGKIFSTRLRAASGALTIAVTQGAVAADANTTVFVKSLMVDGLV